MKAVLLDRLYQKRKTFIYFMLFSMVLSFFPLRNPDPLKLLILYLILSMYWNLLFKAVGRARNWDLIWSLPLKEWDILVGTSLSLILTGWAMNLLLFLYLRFYLPLPWKLLLIICCLTLFTDVILQMMSYSGRNKLENYTFYVVWIALSFLPLLLGKEKLHMLIQWLIGLSTPYLLLVATALYLVLSFLLFSLIKRNRKRARNQQ